MGDVISLQERRIARRSAAPGPAVRARAVFWFDLASPFTYLAAERVDRLFGGVEWLPANAEMLGGGDLRRSSPHDELRRVAEERARLLEMPLVWPDPFPSSTRMAMRVAAAAAEHGRAAAFVLACSRLAFCGGFALDEPDVLAEAAAAAGLGLDDALDAAADPSRDGEATARGLRLLAQGADRLPVLRIGRTLFCGEERIAEAAARARTLAPERRRVESDC